MGDVQLSNETAQACVQIIEHFVAKGGKGFLEKNTDALSGQFEGVLKGSALSVVRAMVEAE